MLKVLVIALRAAPAAVETSAVVNALFEKTGESVTPPAADPKLARSWHNGRTAVTEARCGKHEEPETYLASKGGRDAPIEADLARPSAGGNDPMNRSALPCRQQGYRRAAVVAATLAVLGACQQAPRTTPAFTPADARTLGLVQTVCAACHGANGVSVSEGIPNLAGQGARYLQRQLLAFRGGTRKHEQMSVVAAGLAVSDAVPLARYFSQQPARGASAPKSPLLPVFEQSRARLPMDFPIGFIHYSTTDDHTLKAVMRTWANEIALRASHSGGPMPDGAIIVSENWSARLDPKGELLHDASGRLVPERVKSYGVMASGAGWGDAIAEPLRNDNWNYAVFKADRTPDVPTNHAVCFACHKSRAADQFVFTQQRLGAASNGSRPIP